MSLEYQENFEISKIILKLFKHKIFKNILVIFKTFKNELKIVC